TLARLQGSVLGPLYYVLYVNEVPGTLTEQVQFADDTLLVLSDEDGLEGLVSGASNKLAFHNLQVNENKTQLTYLATILKGVPLQLAF
ncbi:hypothetical protein HHI36_001127, partial [Cryptolaemus montrouzieri]